MVPAGGELGRGDRRPRRYGGGRLTWQEAAVFLVRTVEALGLEPEAVRTAPLPDALAEGAWDQTALELAWEWGLLPEDAGSAAEIARVQGGAMADAFAALL